MSHTFTVGDREFTATGPPTREDFHRLMKQVARVAGVEIPTAEQVKKVLDTHAGRLLLVTDALKKLDPTVTHEWVLQHVPTPAAVATVLAHLAIAAGLKGE